MAVIFFEGFDKYGPIGQHNPDIADLMVQGEWTAHGGGSPTWSIIAGLSRTGTAFRYGAGLNAWVSKTLPDNYGRLIGGIRFRWASTDSSRGGPIIQFQDIVTAQCSVRLEADGRIAILQGDYATGIFGGGVILATSGYAISQLTSHFLEFDITFGSSGTYEFWLDGNSVLSGTGNLIKTAHSYSNGIVIGNNAGLTLNDMELDDLYLFDATGSIHNAPLLTNPRVETRYPNADTQTQFTNVATLLGEYGAATADTNAPGSNQLFLRKFTADVNQTIVSVSCIPGGSSGTAKFAAVMYSDNAGVPNALISAGVEVIGATTGVVLSSNLTSPQSVTASTPYWIGYITDTSVALVQSNSTSTLGVKAANTYASGAPDPAPAMTINQASWLLWGNCTGSAKNWNAVNSDPAAGNYSSIASSNSGDADLYTFPALTATTADVYAVAVKGSMKRSDSGARTIDLRLKSGATNNAGSASGFTAGTSYEWHDTYFEQNPNGPTGWTLTTANAIQAGPKVAS